MQYILLACTTAVGVAFAACYWYINMSKRKNLKVGRSVERASVIIDEKFGIRASTRNADLSEIHYVKFYHDFLQHAIGRSGSSKCFGRRPSFTEPAEWYTYDEVGELIKAFGSGLISLLGSATDGKGTKLIGIYGRNSVEWVCAQNACSAYGFVSVPLYSTYGPEALSFIVEQTRLCAVVCDGFSEAETILSCAKDAAIRALILVNATNEEFRKLGAQKHETVQLLTVNDVLELGRTQVLPFQHANEEDMFLICYTSGSTGLPKGVLFTHRQFIRSVLSAVDSFAQNTAINENSLHISYLPMAHVMEQILMSTFLFRGAMVAFITTNFHQLMSDLQFYRPTHFFAVPRVLCGLHTKVMKAIGSYRLLNRLLKTAVDQKMEEQQRGIYSSGGLLDFFFFRPIRKLMGGRIQFALCSSAPLSEDVLKFTRAALSCPMIEVYGSTELGGLATATSAQDMEGGKAGMIQPGILIRLADVPELDIIASRDGLGEVCVKSPSATKGYYKDEVKTRDLFDEFGYVRTGDLGRWGKDGSLIIVDRCKSLFKLSQGEYVVPDKVERVYASSPLITHILVDGSPLESYAVAIVVPDIIELRKLCSKTLTVSEMSADDTELCNSLEVHRIVLEELTRVGRDRGLVGLEQVKAIHLTTEPFSIENGLLTATMKLARSNARSYFAKTIKDLYTRQRK